MGNRFKCTGWAMGVLVMLVMAFGGTGCQPAESGTQEGAEAEAVAKAEVEVVAPDWAHGFRWLQHPGGPDREVLECVAPDGTTGRVFRDSTAWKQWEGGDGDVVLGPMARGIATLSTTHVALLEPWGGLAHWAGGGSTRYLRMPGALAGLASGKAVDYSQEQGLDKEKLLAHPPACLTAFPFGDPLAGTGIEGVVPVVELTEYLEPHPLGRAEWMRALAWLAGPAALAQADSAFAACARRYGDLAASVAQRRKGAVRPEVFTGSVQEGVWHAPGGGSLIARFLEDAGAKYAFADQPGAENVRISLEQMRVVQARADAWGWVVHAPEGATWENLFGKGSTLRDFVPPSGRVFVANSAECDYFGAVIAQPDALLANLVRLLHPDLALPAGTPDAACFEWIRPVP